MIKKFIALSGLPRSGSTLLSAILSQNPKIYSEGISALCQLMWDTQENYKDYEAVYANNRMWTIKNIVSAMPEAYYKHVDQPIIVDKCRSWTLPANMELLKNYIDKNPKVIVLERPIIEIVKSFVNIRKQNNWEGDLEARLLNDESEPIMRSYDGVKWAKANNNGEFLFIQYDDLVHNTKGVIEKIYKFCELKPFKHDLNNIINKHPQNDEIYNLIGLHDIRPTINKRYLDVVLTDATIKKCKAIDNS